MASKVCLYQFDNRTDEQLGDQALLVQTNAERCATSDECSHTFEREEQTEHPPWWSKVLLVQKHMEQHPECDIVAWLDTDAVLNKDPQELDKKLGDRHMLISKDLPMWGDDVFNAGAWAVRNTTEGRAIMSDWADTYPKDKWNLTNKRWTCLQSAPDLPRSEKCAWAKEQYEQGCFSLNILPKHKAAIAHENWNVMNNSCLTQDHRNDATVCHFSLDLKRHIPDYMQSVSFHKLD